MIGGELVAGASLGLLFNELYREFKEMKDPTKRFGGRLKILNSTLESLDFLIFKQQLDLPASEIEDIKRKMKKGKELVGKLSQIRKREYLDFFVDRKLYIYQLDAHIDQLKDRLRTLKHQQSVRYSVTIYRIF